MVKSLARELLSEQRHKTHVTAARLTMVYLADAPSNIVQLDAQCCTPTFFKALSRVRSGPTVRAVPGQAGHKAGETREEWRKICGVETWLSPCLAFRVSENEDAPHDNSAAYSTLLVQETCNATASPPYRGAGSK